MSEKLTVVDLADLEIPTEIVEVSETQAIEVTGVPYNELMRLFKDNIELLDKALQGDSSAVTDLIEEQPKRVGYLIAYACNGAEAPTEKQVAIACKLGAYTQGKIVQAMFNLTFPDPEALGKFMAEVETLWRTMVVAGIQQKVAIASGITRHKP